MAEEVEGDEAQWWKEIHPCVAAGCNCRERLIDQIRSFGKRQFEAGAKSIDGRFMVREAESQVATLQEKLRQAEEQWEIVSRGKSPCGHWAAHAMTSDGGKTITCLQCRAEKAEAALEAAKAEHEREILDEIRKREERELQIEDCAMAFGCEEEWSSAHDHGHCIQEYASCVVSVEERDSLRAALEVAQKAAENSISQLMRVFGAALCAVHRKELDTLSPSEYVAQEEKAGCAQCTRAALEEERGKASPVSRDEANELQDILRTLTPSGTALKTSARELVVAWEKGKAELAAEREAHQRTRELAGSECVDHGQRISDLEGALREAEKFISDAIEDDGGSGPPDPHPPEPLTEWDQEAVTMVTHLRALLSRLPEPPA